MCKRAVCGSCGRPTYTGCGAHIEQVLGDVPAAERCQCNQGKVEGADRSGSVLPTWLRGLRGK